MVLGLRVVAARLRRLVFAEIFRPGRHAIFGLLRAAADLPVIIRVTHVRQIRVSRGRGFGRYGSADNQQAVRFGLQWFLIFSFGLRVRRRPGFVDYLRSADPRVRVFELASAG